jgi:riboflavin synthase
LFTGLIEGTGTVLRSGGGEIQLRCDVLEGVRRGESVAVDGVCLTVSDASDSGVTFHTSPETSSRSLISGYARGTVVNVERPVTASGRLHGHMVTGHVDCVSTILRTVAEGVDRRIWIRFDSRFAGLLVEKGSVAVNGVSLTVASIRGDSFSVVMIPDTLDRTNAGSWKPGSRVNLEFDIIGKYVQRFLGIRDGESRLRSYLEEGLES